MKGVVPPAAIFLFIVGEWFLPSSALRVLRASSTLFNLQPQSSRNIGMLGSRNDGSIINWQEWDSVRGRKEVKTESKSHLVGPIAK